MRKLDEMIEQVFESNSIPTSADPRIQKELEFLQSLKSNLKNLNNVPECQLNTEHLRLAILNQKPTATPVKSRIWLWSPLAVAASVVAILTVLPRQDIVGHVVSNGNQLAPARIEKQLNLDVPRAASTVVASREDSSGKAQVTRVEKALSSTKLRRKTSRTKEIDRPSGSTTEVTGLTVAKDSANLEKSLQPGESSMKVASFEATQAAADNPVVVVTDSSDSATGANNAKEVNQTVNVVFGG